MEVKYKLNDGAVITAPDGSDKAFWTAMRDSSKFDSHLDVKAFRLAFTLRLKTQSDIVWLDVWTGNDVETLKKICFIMTDF